MRPAEDTAAEGIWGCLIKNGVPCFSLYDQIAGRTFQCVVPDALLPQAMESCHRRVEIAGTILESEYIQVTQIRSDPEPNQIPSLADMRRLIQP
jgi:hypothetical protein